MINEANVPSSACYPRRIHPVETSTPPWNESTCLSSLVRGSLSSRRRWAMPPQGGDSGFDVAGEDLHAFGRKGGELDAGIGFLKIAGCPVRIKESHGVLVSVVGHLGARRE